jgi:hypothetical protein
MFGMALLSALARPAREVWRHVRGIMTPVLRFSVAVYSVFVASVGGFLVYALAKETWTKDVASLPKQLMAWLAVRWIKVLRVRALLRISRLRTEFGFTVRRRLAVATGKKLFLAAFAAMVWSAIALGVMLVTHHYSSVQLVVGVAATVTLLILAFSFDVIGDRADLRRYDMLVSALPEARKIRGETFWATTTRDAGLIHPPLSPRLHERLEAGSAPYRSLSPARQDWVPEAGAWF